MKAPSRPSPQAVELQPLAEFHRGKVTTIQLRAGDTVVIQAAGDLSLAAMERIEHHLGRFVPDGVKVLVLDGGLTLGVLRREDGR